MVTRIQQTYVCCQFSGSTHSTSKVVAHLLLVDNDGIGEHS